MCQTKSFVFCVVGIAQGAKPGPAYVTFRELEERGHQRGDTVLGYYLINGHLEPESVSTPATKNGGAGKKTTNHGYKRSHVVLNPPKNQKIPLDPDLIKVVVISSFEN